MDCVTAGSKADHATFALRPLQRSAHRHISANACPRSRTPGPAIQPQLLKGYPRTLVGGKPAPVPMRADPVRPLSVCTARCRPGVARSCCRHAAFKIKKA
jgi:hypothetical protein